MSGVFTQQERLASPRDASLSSQQNDVQRARYIVRRHWVHTLICTFSPSTIIAVFCTFGLKVRLVFGARRAQPPDALCRMLRPKLTLLLHTIHFAIIRTCSPGFAGHSNVVDTLAGEYTIFRCLTQLESV